MTFRNGVEEARAAAVTAGHGTSWFEPSPLCGPCKLGRVMQNR